MVTILVTGAGGYIGSHAAISLLDQGYDIVAFDDFSRSKSESLSRVKKLTGKHFPIIKGDVRDAACLEKLFTDHKIDYIMHFAGLKAVGESVENPGAYYDVNVSGTRLLADIAIRSGVKGLVFSSSATVYGDPQNGQVDENAPTSPANPYGWSKLMAEQILTDMANAADDFDVALLRYFNPVGAHPSGDIGEDPVGIPANLLPFVAQVAVGIHSEVRVFGHDFSTPDGTGVRDYIHVMDLVDGHIKAIEYLQKSRKSYTVNLGTGRGYSVMEVLNAFQKASKRDIPHVIAPRRAGDVASVVADPSSAQALLHWQAQYDLGQMCRDHWNWQLKNPTGYS